MHMQRDEQSRQRRQRHRMKKNTFQGLMKSAKILPSSYDRNDISPKNKSKSREARESSQRHYNNFLVTSSEMENKKY